MSEGRILPTLVLRALFALFAVGLGVVLATGGCVAGSMCIRNTDCGAGSYCVKQQCVAHVVVEPDAGSSPDGSAASGGDSSGGGSATQTAGASAAGASASGNAGT